MRHPWQTPVQTTVEGSTAKWRAARYPLPTASTGVSPPSFAKATGERTCNSCNTNTTRSSAETKGKPTSPSSVLC